MPRRILLADLDGTLVDSAPDLAHALGTVMQEHGLPAPGLAAVKGMVGDGPLKLVERALAAAGEDVARAPLQAMAARFLELYEAEAAGNSQPFPGIIEAIGALKEEGWRLAVCTNKPQRATHLLLDALSMTALFEEIAGGDRYAVKKPDPGHVLKLLAAMGGTPDEAILVGDSANDVKAGRGAGLPVVLASWGYGSEAARPLRPERVIDFARELPDAVRDLARS